MEDAQNLTDDENKTDTPTLPVQVSPEPIEITPQHDEYIAFVACNGMLPTEDSSELVRKMTASEFAQNLGVARETLYAWRKSIPNFWDRVDQKRREIGGKDRLSKVWNGIYLKAASGNPQAAAIYLANFAPKFVMPGQKAEREGDTGIADLLELGRKRQREVAQIQEGEVIDVASA